MKCVLLLILKGVISRVAEKVIEAVCDSTDIIFDPFMGSGSFVYAAMGKVKKIYATELDITHLMQ